MQTTMGGAAAAAAERLELCFSGPECDWTRIYQPKNESMPMASRYQLVYSALAHFVALKRDPSLADKLRPQLDTIYRGLLGSAKLEILVHRARRADLATSGAKPELCRARINVCRLLHRRLWRTAGRTHRTRRSFDDLQRSLSQSLGTSIGVSHLRRELLQQRINGAVQCTLAN